MEPFAEKNPTIEIIWESMDARGGNKRRLTPVYAPIPSATDTGLQMTQESIGQNGQQQIRRGDGIRFSIRSPIAGILSFFDFGTDGTVQQMLPSDNLPQPLVEAGEWVHLPGSFGTTGPWWRIARDTELTSETGMPEGFLFVVTSAESVPNVRSVANFPRNRNGVRSPFREEENDLDEAKLHLSDNWAWGGAEAEILA